MANQRLGSAPTVGTMMLDDSIIVEIGGSIRRITLDKFLDSINQGDESLLRQVAWGVPLKYKVQSSPEWGRVGNLDMWEEYKRQSGCYVLTHDGRAAKYYTEKGHYADGTPYQSIGAETMIFHPRLYYRVIENKQTNIPILWMSLLPIGGHYLEQSFIGKYLGRVYSGNLHSWKAYTPTGGFTIREFWDAAQKNGKDWGLINYDIVRKMAMLALSEYGSPNIQSKLGYGVCGSTSVDIWASASKLSTGLTNDLGDGFGKVDITISGGTNNSHTSLLGVEDWYGWYWQMVQGVYFGSSANSGQNGTEIFIYKGNRLPTEAELSTHPNGEYRQLTRQTSSDWIQEIIGGEHFDIFPSKIGGSNTSYLTDYTYNNNSGQLLLLGGSAISGADCGSFYSHSLSAFSYASSTCGSRLAYYGNVTIVDGKDL